MKKQSEKMYTKIEALEKQGFQMLRVIAKENNGEFLFDAEDLPTDDSNNSLIGFSETHVIFDGGNCEEAYPIESLNIYEVWKLLVEVELMQKRAKQSLEIKNV